MGVASSLIKVLPDVSRSSKFAQILASNLANFRSMIVHPRKLPC